MADTRNFMWDNLPGSRARKVPVEHTLTTGDAEGLGTKDVEPTDESSNESSDEVEE